MKKYEKPAIKERNLCSTVSFMQMASGNPDAPSRKNKDYEEDDNFSDGW